MQPKCVSCGSVKQEDHQLFICAESKCPIYSGEKFFCRLCPNFKQHKCTTSVDAFCRQLRREVVKKTEEMDAWVDKAVETYNRIKHLIASLDMIAAEGDLPK